MRFVIRLSALSLHCLLLPLPIELAWSVCLNELKFIECESEEDRSKGRETTKMGVSESVKWLEREGREEVKSE